MSDHLNWLETVSQESADANVDLKPNDNLECDEASDKDLVDKGHKNGESGKEHDLSIDVNKENIDVDQDAGDQESQNGAHNEVKAKPSTEEHGGEEQPEGQDDVQLEITGGEQPDGGVSVEGEDPAEVAPEEDTQAAEPVEGEEQPGEPVPVVEPAEGDESPAAAVEPETQPEVAESGEVEAEAEPEVTVDPVAEIKEGAEPTAEEAEDSNEDFDAVADTEITEDIDGVNSDVESLGLMTNSLEAYADLVEQQLQTGGAVSPQLVKAIQIGLEAFHEPFLTQGHPSLEDFTSPTGKFTVSNEFLSDLKSKAQVAGSAVKEAIKRLLERLKAMLAEFHNNIPALLEANGTLEERLKAIKSEAKQATVSVKGAQRLFIGDHFAGDNAQGYARLRQFGDLFMIDYPKLNRVLAEGVKEAIENTDAKRAPAVSDIAPVFERSFKPGMFGVLGGNTDDIPGFTGRYAQVFASPRLLGNAVMAVGRNPAPEKDGISALSDIWKVGMVSLDTGVDASKEIKVPGLVGLRQIVKELDLLIKQVPKYVEQGNKVAADRQILRLQEVQLSGSLQHAVSGLVGSMTVPTGHVVGHIVNTIKVAQAFVAHCIAQHEAASA